MRMNIIKLKILVKSIGNNSIACAVEHEATSNLFIYHPATKELTLENNNRLTTIINNNRFQLEKVLNSALKGQIGVGQSINCVFIEDFPFLNDAQYNQFIRIDRRHKKLLISASASTKGTFYKLFTDGSYVCETGHSAYAGLIESAEGQQAIFNKAFANGSSNLMELLAVIDGMERLRKILKVQLFTDSRFVIRGLTQWIHFWQHNNWQTSSGNKVKFAHHWQHLHQLCEGKLMELKWIKSHSGHLEQSFCHHLAKQTAENIKRIG